MIFPVWDDQVHNWHTPYFSWLFLLINIGVFAFQLTLSPEMLTQFFYTYGTVPAEIMSWNQLYTLLTNMFLHGWWAHILGNMFFLYVFADNIEASIWNRKFALFYLSWWVAASFAHIAFNMGSMVPWIWASGAIAAVLGAYLVMFPHGKVKLINTQTMKATLIPASYFLGLRIVQQFTSWVGSLVETSGSGGVARWAHVWWFAFGWLFWLTQWKYTGKMKLQQWSWVAPSPKLASKRS